MSDSTEHDIQELINSLSERLKVDVELLRKVTLKDLEYLYDHCPFLQITNTELRMPEAGREVQFITSSTNWIIHDYGDALSSSPGQFLIGGGRFRTGGDVNEDEGGGDVNPGTGTIVNQAFLTACDMVQVAQNQGWAGIRFVDGHPLMARAAWIKAGSLDLTCENYEPGTEDYRIRKLLDMSPEEMKNRLRIRG